MGDWRDVRWWRAFGMAGLLALLTLAAASTVGCGPVTLDDVTVNTDVDTGGDNGGGNTDGDAADAGDENNGGDDAVDDASGDDDAGGATDDDGTATDSPRREPPPADDPLVPPAPIPTPDVIEATFDVDDNDWRVVGGPFPASARPNHAASGGVPGGHVWASGGGWYWIAPAEFLGDVSAAFGYALAFDLNQSHLRYPNADKLLILEGGGNKLVHHGAYAPGVAWTSYSIRLDETGKWWNLATNQRADDETILATLADLGQLKIRGWCSDGRGDGGLDNVRLCFDDLRPTPPGDQVVSTFDDDADEWIIGGGSFGRVGVVRHATTGGAPGGEVNATGGGAWYWIAPPKFRGDMSAAYGRTLSFDINQSGLRYANGQRGVVLNGGGHALYIDLPTHPREHWTGFSVRLDETAEWHSYNTGARASEIELRAVLGDLQQLKIRGWYSDGQGVAGLDNVVLNLADGLTPPIDAVVRSTFDADDEGWLVAGGGFDRGGPLRWGADLGSDGGGVSVTQNGAWYWIAPPKFRGDWSAAYGGTVSFDVLQSGTRYANRQNQLVIDGGGYSVAIAAPFNVSTAWTHFSLTLDEEEEWFHYGTGDRVNYDQMLAVLADVRQLKIRGWYSDGSGTGGLDNVAVAGPDRAPRRRR